MQDLLNIQWIFPQIGADFDILADCQVGDQIIHLEDIPQVLSSIAGQLFFFHRIHPRPANIQIPAVCRIDAADNIEQRGFSGSRGAQQDAELALLHAEADSPKNLYAAVPFSERFLYIIQFQQQLPILQRNSRPFQSAQSAKLVMFNHYSALFDPVHLIRKKICSGYIPRGNMPGDLFIFFINTYVSRKKRSGSFSAMHAENDPPLVNIKTSLNILQMPDYASAAPRLLQSASPSSSGAPLIIRPSATRLAPASLASSSQRRIHSPSPHP